MEHNDVYGQRTYSATFQESTVTDANMDYDDMEGYENHEEASQVIKKSLHKYLISRLRQGDRSAVPHRREQPLR